MRQTRWLVAIALLLVALLAVPGGSSAQPPTLPDTVRGTAPRGSPTISGRATPLLDGGLLYLTSLDIGDLNFAVYDPGADAWTALTPYETGCQMAASGSGQLYAYGYATGTIDLYDPATDTWAPVMAAPPGASGWLCNLEMTFDGEFLYTEAWATSLWYTAGGVWNTMALPFQANVMGDYDPVQHQYVIGELWTTNAHLIDLNTWTIADFISPVGNGEYARFSVAMANRYFFEAAGSSIHSFDLSEPSWPPFDHGVVAGWYCSAAADRANAQIYVASIDGSQLWAFDGASGLVPLTGYGGLWHSSVAFVPTEAADTLHIDRMKANWHTAMTGGYRLTALVRVYDQGAEAVEGASVYGEWTLPNGSVEPQLGTTPTNYLGIAKFRLKSPQVGVYQFCVTDLVLAGYGYDPGANQDGPCKDVTVP